MAGFTELILKSNAYRLLSADKTAGRLSHAYMLLTSDKQYLREYLKIFARLIMCENSATSSCNVCRICRLISEEKLADAHFYPENKGDKLGAKEAGEIIEETFVKPYELDKKIFIIEDIADMNISGQNKLLKTVEEPSQNTFILIGASSIHAVLPTVQSRVKKLEIPAFSTDELMKALIVECPDVERLTVACRASDGTYGDAKKLYFDEDFAKANGLAKWVLTNMQSSRDVLKVMTEVSSSGVKTGEFLDALEVLFYDMMVYFSAKRVSETLPNAEFFKELKGFNRASAVYALDRIKETKVKDYFNGNDIMMLERLLLQILEGKYKWKR